MAEKTYGELLRDVRWQKKRLEILQRDNWTCQTCQATEENEISLHVHHKQYRRGAKPWEYDPGDLITLCEDCHEETTATTKVLKEQLAQLSPGYLPKVIGFVQCLRIARDYEEGDTYQPRTLSEAWGASQAMELPESAVPSVSYPYGVSLRGPGLPVDIMALWRRRDELWHRELNQDQQDAGTDEVDL